MKNRNISSHFCSGRRYKICIVLLNICTTIGCVFNDKNKWEATVLTLSQISSYLIVEVTLRSSTIIIHILRMRNGTSGCCIIHSNMHSNKNRIRLCISIALIVVSVFSLDYGCARFISGHLWVLFWHHHP